MRSRTPVLAAALLLGGVGACENDVNYAYTHVDVALAETATPDFLSRIYSCGVNVRHNNQNLDFSALACPRPVTSANLGAFEWSTTVSGSVEFVVTLVDVTQRTIGTGSSGPITVVPGGTVNAKVTVTPDPAALQPQ